MKKANFVNVNKVSGILFLKTYIDRKFPVEIKKRQRIKKI